MRARAALAALALLGLPAAAAAAPRTLVLPTLFGEYRLAFDDARASASELGALAVLSPHLAGWTSLAVAPRLERCVVGDKAYLDCRPRPVASPGFLWNARVNLERGNAALAGLRELRAPAELGPVVTWLTRSLALSLWLEETKLEFYRTGDVGVLRRGYEDVDPGRECAPVVADVARAPSRQAQYELVVLPWHNCVNEAARRRLGDYPMPAWQRFLAAWGITETFVETPPGR
jgi:hypothetical protein